MSCISDTLCAALCGANTELPVNYYTCDKEVKLKWGWNHFILIKCDWLPADITDPAEWAQAVTDGNVVCSPLGILNPGTPNSTEITVSGCGRKDVGEVLYPYNFQTYFGTCDHTGNQFWKQLFDGVGSFRFLTVDCNGLWNLPDAWADHVINGSPAPTGISPGWEFGITTIPSPIQLDGNIKGYNADFEIPFNGVMCEARLDGVLSAICQ